MTSQYTVEFAFVLRAGRMTDGQQRAMRLSGPNMAAIWIRACSLGHPLGSSSVLHGASLLQQCQQEPEKTFVGIEVHPPAWAACCRRLPRPGREPRSTKKTVSRC